MSATYNQLQTLSREFVETVQEFECVDINKEFSNDIMLVNEIRSFAERNFGQTFSADSEPVLVGLVRDEAERSMNELEDELLAADEARIERLYAGV
jgi:hypothetical protein